MKLTIDERVIDTVILAVRYGTITYHLTSRHFEISKSRAKKIVDEAYKRGWLVASTQPASYGTTNVFSPTYEAIEMVERQYNVTFKEAVGRKIKVTE